MLEDNEAPLPLGAAVLRQGGFSFNVWAPYCSRVELKVLAGDGGYSLPMRKEDDGYFRLTVPELKPGTRYRYVLDGVKERPDPASRFQPDGVHGPSCAQDNSFTWTDRAWKGSPFRDMIFYEAHIGTFTQEGTFDGAIRKMPYLKKLGVTCLEIMPVAQFPGGRNWGYDGVCLFAVQNSYGGPDGMKRLVDACHAGGIAVCLDVVYNHLGPEGNYLHDFGPYFTRKYSTPWGDAVNFDDRDSDHIRRFVIENALCWVRDFHIDALRLDAVHEIYDFSARHILRELQDSVRELSRELGRPAHVIAESDLNDSRIIRPERQGGYGLSAQWSDDFHHSMHAYLTGERTGYYADFGRLQDIEKAIRSGFVYDGAYSRFRRRRHGNGVDDLPPEKLVVCIQNHDQVGNRALGDRLSSLVDFDTQKIAAALLLLSPYTPLIFMGQEFSEHAPFRYFIDHSDAELIRLVREGRKKEFKEFGWNEIPDPEREETFLNSKLTWHSPKGSPHDCMFRLYKDLIALRKRYVSACGTWDVKCDERNGWIAIRYAAQDDSRFIVAASFSRDHHRVKLPFTYTHFTEILNTRHRRYGGEQAEETRNPGREIPYAGQGAIAGTISG